jgi:hypothetical protein
MKPFTFINKALTFTLAAAALAFASCKKDSDKNKPDPAAQHQLVKFEESATSYSSFDYNTAGQVIKMVNVEDGQSEAFTIAYGNNNKPSQAASNGHNLVFVYTNNNVLEQALIYNGPTNGEAFGRVKLNYTGNKATEALMYIGSGVEEQPLSKFSYEYYANGDVKKKTQYGWNPFTGAYVKGETLVYEYDSHANPLNMVAELFQAALEMPSAHNPVKETTYDEDDSITNVTTYTYTYDNAGYPTQAEKKSSAPDKPNADVSLIKFSYK